MTSGPCGGSLAKRYYDAIKRRGTKITLRHVDPTAVIYPPLIVNPVLDGAVNPGDTVLSIRADTASGMLIAGDQIVITGVGTYTVSLATNSTTPPADVSKPFKPGYVTVHLATPVDSPGAPDGTSISFIWSADEPVWCAMQNFSFTLQTPSVIAGDVSVKIPSYGLRAQPRNTDMLIVDGQVLSVVVSVPTYQRNDVVYYSIQAR